MAVTDGKDFFFFFFFFFLLFLYKLKLKLPTPSYIEVTEKKKKKNDLAPLLSIFFQSVFKIKMQTIKIRNFILSIKYHYFHTISRRDTTICMT